MQRSLWILRQLLDKIWVNVVGYAALAVVAALLAQFAAPVVPDGWEVRLPDDAVYEVLSILATSMLAVTTFSLSIAVSAFASASNSATPRSAEVLQSDKTTQNVLATFLGAFLFSLVGVIGLQAGLYDTVGRLILFVFACVVVALVVVALLRWIGHLMTFGRMNDTLDRVEAVALKALRARRGTPFLGGQPLEGPIPAGARPVMATTIGYVQHIDMGALADCARALDGRLWVEALPGSFVHRDSALLYLEGREPSDEERVRLCESFTCAKTRTFDQDPRFGLIVLAEIASRALSPAVNDPGSAIAVIGRLVRLLAEWETPVAQDVSHEGVHVRGLAAQDLIDDAFRSIARDGAGMVEVHLRLHKALGALSVMCPRTFAREAQAMSAQAWLHSVAANMPEHELDLIAPFVLAQTAPGANSTGPA